MQLVKAELRVASDAAARHAAHTLLSSGNAAGADGAGVRSEDVILPTRHRKARPCRPAAKRGRSRREPAATARAAAVSSAADNRADGSSPVVLNGAADVRFGTWDAANKRFTASAAGAEGSATAIEVTARRTAARDCAAAVRRGGGTRGGAVAVRDSSIPGSYIDVARDMEVAGTGTLTLPGGTYYIDDLTIKANATLTFSDPATLYLSGNLIVNGTLNTSGNVPANLKVYAVTENTTIDLASSSHSYMDFYGPQTAFKMAGSSTLLGSVVGKSVQLSGNATVIFDESLMITLPAVSLVK